MYNRLFRAFVFFHNSEIVVHLRTQVGHQPQIYFRDIIKPAKIS